MPLEVSGSRADQAFWKRSRWPASHSGHLSTICCRHVVSFVLVSHISFVLFSVPLGFEYGSDWFRVLTIATIDLPPCETFTQPPQLAALSQACPLKAVP